MIANMSGTQNEKFCLRWNDFETNISQSFRELRDDKDFFDVTLACDDRQVEAHKVILSACSPFFRTVLKKNPHQHPLLFLRGVQYTELVAVLDFMYHGEVNVAQEDLNSFLAVAEDLSVKGLTQNSKKETDRTSNSSSKREPLKRQISHENSNNHSVERTAKHIKVANAQNYSNSSGSDYIQHSGSPNNHVVNRISNEEVREIAPASNLAIKTESQDPIVVLEDNDESYQEDQTYDYQQGYDEQSMQYENNPIAVPSGTPGTIGESSQERYGQYVTKVIEGSGYNCVLCGKHGRDMYFMREHLEAKHDLSPGYHCPLCQQFCRNHTALKNHIKKCNQS